MTSGWPNFSTTAALIVLAFGTFHLLFATAVPTLARGSSSRMYNRAQSGVTGVTESESDSNLSVKSLDSPELGDDSRLVGLTCKQHFVSG